MTVADDGSAAEVQRSGGAGRFREDPPIQVHLETAGHQMDEALQTYESYRASVPDGKRALLGRDQIAHVARPGVGGGSVRTPVGVGGYRIAGVARRVVGVGSVGTLVWVCLRHKTLLEAVADGALPRDDAA